MTPREWEEFEELVTREYVELLLWELMREESILLISLKGASLDKDIPMLKVDKTNLRLRICRQLIIRRIDSIIEKGERNGN